MFGKLSKLLKEYHLAYWSIPWDAEHNDFVDQYLSNRYEFQTLIVFQNPIERKRKLKDNLKYYDITTEKYVSILDEKVNKELMENNNRLCKVWEDKIVAQGINPNSKQYGKQLDIEVELTRKEYKKELYQPTMDEEAFFRLLDVKPSLEQEDEEKIEQEIKDFLEIEKNKKAIHRHITKTREGKKFKRIFKHQIPELESSLIEEGYNAWLQVFIVIDHESKIIQFLTGKGTGSGGRQMHGFACHLFAELKNKGKHISSHGLFFNHLGEVFNYTEDNLILINPRLGSNYGYDESKSGAIFKQNRIINHAEDLAFDLFISTGKTLNWGKI